MPVCLNAQANRRARMHRFRLSAIKTLSLLLRDKYVGGHAAEALGKIGPDAWDAVPFLLDALKRDEARVRVESARALGLIKAGQKAVTPLKAALADFNPEVRAAAGLAHFRISGEAETALAALIPDLHLPAISPSGSMPAATPATADALGLMGAAARPAVPALLRAIWHENYDIHRAAVDALKKVDPEAARNAGFP